MFDRVSFLAMKFVAPMATVSIASGLIPFPIRYRVTAIARFAERFRLSFQSFFVRTIGSLSVNP